MLEVPLSVMGPRGGLRVVLHGEYWSISVPDAFHGAVIEVEMRHLQSVGPRNAAGVALHREPMVL